MLSFVVSKCQFVTYPFVSWARCIVSIPDLRILTYFERSVRLYPLIIGKESYQITNYDDKKKVLLIHFIMFCY